MNAGRNDDAAPRRIEAASFEVAVEPPAMGATDHRWRNRLLAVIAAVLAAVVLLVVLVLPRWVGAPDARPAPVTVSSATPPAAEVEPETEVASAPPAAQDAVAQRKDTQAQLRETLEKVQVLESLAAEHWAKRDLHAIRTRIAEGEAAYREQRYVTAQNIYLETSQRVERLMAKVPDIVSGLLDAGRQALTDGDSSAARTAFERVLEMQPDNADATAGLARAATLDRVLALIGEAEGYLQLGERNKAAAAWREALALDAEAPGAAAALARIERDDRADAFRAAMSEGFGALGEQRFGAARTAFSRAQKLDPSRAEAAAALQQLANAETSFHVERALDKAGKAEREESWDTALAAYDEALKHDARLSPAVAGKRRAEQRQRLDAQLVAYLARPERLGSEAVHDEARQVLAQARALNASGARITGQVDALARALELARTPLEITLSSDGATAVTVYRVGELGRFEQRALTLLPGAYTAVGKRDGYRDVRVEFSVAHGRPATAVDVRCVDKLAFGN